MSDFDSEDFMLIQHFQTFAQGEGFVTFVGSESMENKFIYTIGGIGVGTSPELAQIAALKSCAEWLEFVTPEQIQLLPAPDGVLWRIFKKENH